MNRLIPIVMRVARAAVLALLLIGVTGLGQATLDSTSLIGQELPFLTAPQALAEAGDAGDDVGDDDDYSPSNEEARETAEEGVDIADDEDEEMAEDEDENLASL
ncbi:MAG: hypothetical protein ACKVVP_14355 [Chloroflexota bacterium]